jgi:hypothetical protein
LDPDSKTKCVIATVLANMRNVTVHMNKRLDHFDFGLFKGLRHVRLKHGFIVGIIDPVANIDNAARVHDKLLKLFQPVPVHSAIYKLLSGGCSFLISTTIPGLTRLEGKGNRERVRVVGQDQDLVVLVTLQISDVDRV